MQIEMKQTESQQHEISPTPSQQGLLFVLSAPSGAGKDTVIQALQAQGVDFFVVPSVTTRAPRPGESEGKPYYFVDPENFERMVVTDELLEHALVHGNWYGQPRQPIRDTLRSGQDVLLKIDVQGATTIRRLIPQAIFIFLHPGSSAELAHRLETRSTETAEELQRRLRDAETELAEQHWYDYLVFNHHGRLQEAVDDLRAIMRAEHCRVTPRQITL
ncbi:MAG TPA: guanylate kinase [Ktedonobacteraceae bacterium]|nr:guanylate kinase [Ktedonobacteraceae bacterium]